MYCTVGVLGCLWGYGLCLCMEGMEKTGLSRNCTFEFPKQCGKTRCENHFQIDLKVKSTVVLNILEEIITMLQGGAVSAPPLPPGTTGSTTQMPASSYNHINEMIRHKERELQQIQDIRNAQLENMLEERDRLLVESSRRFEQLKEDFTYNLQLIEARDQEMERLEHQLQSKDQDIQLLQDDIKSLTMKIEHMNKREIDKMQKAEQERGNHKKIFDELKAVIESIQFSAEEENKHKQMEIDKLKKDLDVLYQSKEHALELQRKDLTNTFEQILQQREEQYQTKENDIQSQIQCIDTRFEKLQTENIFFKEQCRDYKAKYEHAIEASQQKDDKIRQLTYQVEDERNLKTSLEDSFTRQSHQQQQEIQRLIDLRMKEKMDAENALEQVSLFLSVLLDVC